jgi:hypothetical protein
VRRDPALATLSRDHHQALFVSQKLRRARVETATDALTALRAYWHADGREHFRIEEEDLLPAYAAYGDPYDPLLARVVCDHIAIRQRIRALDATDQPSLDELHELGRLIDAHVRCEERELFPRIEAALPDRELAALGAALRGT